MLPKLRLFQNFLKSWASFETLKNYKLEFVILKKYCFYITLNKSSNVYSVNLQLFQKTNEMFFILQLVYVLQKKKSFD